MFRNAFDDLSSRGFVYQCTNEEATRTLLSNKSTIFYVGFDPTADSLHVGHLLPIMAIRRMQSFGHRPIVLIGGATGMVGDPSGKIEARPLMTQEKLQQNVQGIRQQLAHFISVDDAIFANNADWFATMGYLQFLREVGPRFSINRMLTMESVKMRLEGTLSFLEFNYMLLQAYDFHELLQRHGCQLQMGGQDQWGNIVSGVELIRKMDGQEVFGFTIPLLLDSNGKKFGKTAGGAVWLDANRTSTFDYYQFWRNCDDADVGKLLKFFTNLPLNEIDQLSALPAPEINRAKEILAYEATSLAHGKEEAGRCFLAACSKFGFADPSKSIYTSSTIAEIEINACSIQAELPTVELSPLLFEGEGCGILQLFCEAGLTSSNSEARRLIQGGGASLNGEKIKDPAQKIKQSDFSENSIVLKAGKKQFKKVILSK